MSLNMGNVLGLIFANMHDMLVKDLTQTRTTGSVLFGGRYRLIDFPLSNMVNSGITKVGVITKSNYQSLLDHIGSAREWDMARKNGGLSILPPFGNNNVGLYRGRLEALNGARSFIKNAKQEYVVISDCDIVTNMDFRPIIEQHIKSGAEITVVAHTDNYTADEIENSTMLSVDEEGRVRSATIQMKNASGYATLSMNMFVMTKKYLIDLMEDAEKTGKYSFETDILRDKVDKINIRAYEYKNYFRRIYSMQSYFDANMDIINPENTVKLFPANKPIYTKVRDNAPAKYGAESEVKNSLIADGCVIEGSVENSVLFRGVKVGRGAKIRNAILMQNTVIDENVSLDYVITDKSVKIHNDNVLKGVKNYTMFLGKSAEV